MWTAQIDILKKYTDHHYCPVKDFQKQANYLYIIIIDNKISIIDLKSHPFLRKIFGKSLWGYTDVYRTIDFQAVNGFYTVANFSPLCDQIPRRLQNKNILMPGSVFMHGIRSNYPLREFTRYRNLPTRSKKEVIPHRHSWQHFKVNSCRSQRKTRLAYSYTQNSPKVSSILCWISKAIFLVYPYLRWQVTRCQRSRSFAVRSRCILCNGSRLSGLQKTLRFQPDSCIFCYPSQEEYTISKALFDPVQKDTGLGYRTSIRPDNRSNRVLYKQALSRHSAPSEVQGCLYRQNTCVSHQQLRNFMVLQKMP